MFSPNRNLGGAIAVQDLKGIHDEIFFLMSPPTKILAPPLYTVYILYIYIVTCAPPPIFIRGGPHGLHSHFLLCLKMFDAY